MTIRHLAAEMRVDECAYRAAWAYAQAAARPWWAPVRRALLVRKARLLERKMDAWAASLFEEIRTARLAGDEL